MTRNSGFDDPKFSEVMSNSTKPTRGSAADLGVRPTMKVLQLVLELARRCAWVYHEPCAISEVLLWHYFFASPLRRPLLKPAAPLCRAPSLTRPGPSCPMRTLR